MSAFFAHDLKNTASTLSLTLQNLRKHFGNPEFREDALRAVSRSANHINRVVNGLSTLQHELKLDLRREDLHVLVQQVMTEMDTALSVRPELDLQEVPPILLDAKQVKKVLINLLLNAGDAVSESGHISLQTIRRSEWVILSVRDDGCGMTPEFVEKSLFRPFQTTKKEGLGIGMFQTRMIVEAHGGRIEVETQPGLGTAFQVLFPLRQ
jgi:signal transduction histidine kinase